MSDLIRRVLLVKNKVYKAVDFWLDNVLGGYVVEFTMEATQSYSAVKG